MLNKDLNLSSKIFTDEFEQKPTRDGYDNVSKLNILHQHDIL